MFDWLSAYMHSIYLSPLLAWQIMTNLLFNIVQYFRNLDQDLIPYHPLEPIKYCKCISDHTLYTTANIQQRASIKYSLFSKPLKLSVQCSMAKSLTLRKIPCWLSGINGCWVFMLMWAALWEKINGTSSGRLLSRRHLSCCDGERHFSMQWWSTVKPYYVAFDYK